MKKTRPKSTTTIGLRNALRSAGYEALARAITQTGNEYHKACRGQNNAKGGNTGAYKRWQDAITRGQEALTECRRTTLSRAGGQL